MNGPRNGTGEPQAGATGEPQAGDPATGQAPAAATGQAPAAGAAQEPAGDNESAADKAARLEREVADLRKENAKHRTTAQQLERERQEAAQAGMTELEREKAARAAAEARAGELEANLRSQAVRAATTQAAGRLNYRNPELAHRLIDASELEFDEHGEPKNAEKLLRDLATREPYLVKAAGQDFGGGNRGGPAPAGEPGMSELLRAALKG